jgi:threonine/homoserine/homoserine lactone efflux protein
MYNSLYLLIKGTIIGFSIAAPIGPISILCMQLTLMHGLAVGVAAGLGAATADACYSAIAGFGLTSISSFLLTQKTVISLVGSLFLIYLGIKSFIVPPTTQAAPCNPTGTLSAYASTFALTFVNPLTILAYMAVFAGLGIVNANNSYIDALALVIGVFLGSALWGLVLCCTIGFFRGRVTSTSMKWINILSGLVILAFAIGILYQLR